MAIMGKLQNMLNEKTIFGLFSLYIIVYYIICFGVYSLAYYRQEPLIALDALTLVGESMVIFVLLYNILHNKMYTEWLFFAGGIIFYYIGDLIRLLYDIEEIHTTAPSLCDVFYLATIVMFFIAIQLFLKKEKLYFFIKAQFDISIILVITTTVIYKFLLLSILNNEALAFSEKIINIIYPISDIVYLTGILIVVFDNNIKILEKGAPLFFIIAFGTFFIADMLYAAFVETHLLVFVKPIWLISLMCIAMASFYGNDKLINNMHRYIQELAYTQRLNYLKFLFPYVLASGFILITSWEYMKNDILATGSVITTLLLILRQIFTIIENDKLLNKLHVSNLALKKQNKKRGREASLDYLTQLYNRRYLTQMIDAYIHSYHRHEQIEFCIFLIDVDHYKQFNDVYGHTFGDKVLVEIANAIKMSIRAEDIAGRYGGDEFMIFLPKISRDSAEKIAQRLLQSINDNNFAEAPGIKITLSIGNLYWKGKKEEYNLTEIIRRVDHILYEAKGRGRNMVISK